MSRSGRENEGVVSHVRLAAEDLRQQPDPILHFQLFTDVSDQAFGSPALTGQEVNVVSPETTDIHRQSGYVLRKLIPGLRSRFVRQSVRGLFSGRPVIDVVPKMRALVGDRCLRW